MSLDISKATAIKRFPFYYVLFDLESKEGQIWLYKPEGDPPLEKQILPNPNGKVMLKRDDGVPVPMMFADIIAKITEAIEQGRAKPGLDHEPVVRTGGRGAAPRQEVEDDGLDKALKNQRITIRMTLSEWMDKAKKARNFDELQKLKPHAMEWEEKLRQFDEKYPEYNDDRKSRKTRRSVDQTPRALSSEEKTELDELYAEWRECCSVLEFKEDVLKEKEVEILRLFGSLQSFHDATFIPKLELKTFI